MHTTPVTCPSCFQEFDVPAPSFGEIPCDVDYDCEVCCRPLRIFFEEADGEVVGTAYGLGASGPLWLIWRPKLLVTSKFSRFRASFASFRRECIWLFAKTEVVVNLEKSRCQESGGWALNKLVNTHTHT